MQLSTFIRVYDNVIDQSKCQLFIDTFEQLEFRHENSSVGAMIDDKEYRSALELNCSKHTEFQSPLRSMNNVAVQIRQRYFDDMKAHGIPSFSVPNNEQLRLEEWRMHRYDVNDSFFKPHVDSHNTKSAQRYLALLFYLNDVEDGGETKFTNHLQEIVCKPKAGTVLVFPTWWGFPHEGIAPISESKYLLKTYFQYA